MSALVTSSGRVKRSGKGQRWAVKIDGRWYPSLRKSQKPRIGGYRVVNLFLAGKITDVAEIKRG